MGRVVKVPLAWSTCGWKRIEACLATDCLLVMITLTCCGTSHSNKYLHNCGASKGAAGRMPSIPCQGTAHSLTPSSICRLYVLNS